MSCKTLTTEDSKQTEAKCCWLKFGEKKNSSTPTCFYNFRLLTSQLLSGRFLLNVVVSKQNVQGVTYPDVIYPDSQESSW